MVLVALAICVFATEEKQDQEAAEQYFARYGFYPSWYSGYYGAGLRSAVYPYAYGAGVYRSAVYPYAYNGLYNHAVVY